MTIVACAFDARFRLPTSSLFAGLFSLLLFVAAAPARADVASDYQSGASFALPSSTALIDTLPDGRIVALVSATIYRESAPGSRSFAAVGTLPAADISSFGAAFVRVSPNGQRIAVGNNGGVSFANFQVGVFSLATLTGTWFTAGHFDAEWIDDRYVALAAGTFGSPAFVTALDTTSANPAAPTNPTLVNNVGGASGGIAFDAAGNLFTANGFQGAGPSGTGAIYAIPRAAWSAALAGAPPVNFETQGIPIVDLLSASPIGFDGAGNLLVGGGDSFSGTPDDNYFAIVHASAIATALAGGGFINAADAAKVRKLDPDAGAASFYTVGVNRARHEIYAFNAGSQTAFVYFFPTPPVPALPASGLVALAVLLLGVGVRFGGRGAESCRHAA